MIHDAKKRIRLAALLALPLPALVCHADPAPPPAAADHVFAYHQQDVLGTAMDVKLIAGTQADADACLSTINGEIERLRLILSTYDAKSEISRLQANPSTGAIIVSEDLHTVLLDYLKWHTASTGAFSPQLTELADFWKAGEGKAAMPTDAELAPLVTKLKETAYVTSLAGTAVRKVNNQPLNIDSLGKGYIVQKAAALAKAKHPAVTGILLNIGGDITALGMLTPPGVKPPLPWTITIADPKQAAVNAPPITTIKVTNKAVATSGVYERFYTFGDQKLSHILNPLTGKPSNNDVLSATVVASDNATANALATILCVVPPADGMKLVEKTAGASALLIMADGKQASSKGFSAYDADLAPSTPLASISPPDNTPAAPSGGGAAAPADGAWPANFVVAADVRLIQWSSPTYIPYLAMWVEDSNGKLVKIVAAWVGNKKYMPAMPHLSAISKTDANEFANMTRATRKTGEYVISWDGKDASGNPVGPGTYNLWVEVGFEHGGHGFGSAAITCGATNSKAAIPATPVFSAIPVIYGPGK